MNWKRRRIRYLCALFCLPTGLLLTSPSTAAQERSARERRAAQRQLLYVLKPDGQVNWVSNYVWLAPGRVGVPAWILQRMGFTVNQTLDGRHVNLGVRGSDYTLSLKSASRVYANRAPDNAELGYAFPTAWKHRGQWYVAARAVERSFPGLVRTLWDDETYVLTLQPTEKLQAINQLPQDSR